MKNPIKQHFETGMAVLRNLPFAVVLVPFILFALIYLVSRTGLAWMFEKPVQEIVAPVTIGLAFAVAVASWYWVRDCLTFLIALLCLALFLRELHFEWTNGGIYFLLGGLALLASHMRPALSDVIFNKSLGWMFFGAMLTYALADAVDRHWVIFLEPLLGPEPTWQNYVEETLETVGHMLIFGLVIVTLRHSSVASQQS